MNKGQSAIEFMMTYGWAFVIILAVIGVMAYNGYLDPSRLLPDSCTVNAPFTCKAVAYGNTASAGYPGNEIVLEIVNGVGSTLLLVSSDACGGVFSPTCSRINGTVTGADAAELFFSGSVQSQIFKPMNAKKDIPVCSVAGTCYDFGPTSDYGPLNNGTWINGKSMFFSITPRTYEDQSNAVSFDFKIPYYEEGKKLPKYIRGSVRVRQSGTDLYGFE